jgi:glutamate racemase
LGKLGVFDSGIGGLTVYRALRRELRAPALVYFGDTARVPYGTKSGETVTRFALQIGRYLRNEMKVGGLVVACNTASAYALPALKELLDIPVWGVIEPGARAAVRSTRGGVVGVIGTAGTIASGAYQKAIAAADPAVRVVAAPCPLFVPLVEEGWLAGEIVEQVARRYLAPLVEEKVDTLVLGCTHYPLLRPVIAQVMGPAVTVIDSADETAAEVREHLSSRGELAGGETGEDRFLVTDSAARFAAVGQLFLGRQLYHVDRVDLPEGE